MSTLQDTNRIEPKADDLEMASEGLGQRGQPLAYSVAEAANLLGISRALAYSLARQHRLPVVQLGRRLVIPRRALDQFLDAGGLRES